MSEPVTVWAFADAPHDLQELSTNGGDEDWLALVPADFVRQHGVPLWLETPPFGRCCVDEYPQPDGSMVLIGCHA